MRYYPIFQLAIPHLKVRYLRVTHPFATLLAPEGTFSFNLHVLGTPPAFVLSQNQTLHLNLKNSIKTLQILFKNKTLEDKNLRRSRNNDYLVFKEQNRASILQNLFLWSTCFFLIYPKNFKKLFFLLIFSADCKKEPLAFSHLSYE